MIFGFIKKIIKIPWKVTVFLLEKKNISLKWFLMKDGSSNEKKNLTIFVILKYL